MQHTFVTEVFGLTQMSFVVLNSLMVTFRGGNWMV